MMRVFLASLMILSVVANGFTDPIHDAAAAGDLERLRALLATNAAAVNARSPDDPFEYDTPLHVAARAGQAKAAELLIAKGADLKAKDREGYTPLHVVAGYEGKAEIAEVLLANGADPNEKSRGGITPLHAAAMTGSVAIATVLLAH